MTTKQIANKEQNLTPAQVTPNELITIAVQQNADADKLEKLLALQERWEANEAKKAYNRAIAAFKAESIEILKNKKVSFKTSKGSTEYDHATLDSIVEKVTPLLAKHNLSHRWVPHQEQSGLIRVQCTITHELGHSESVEFQGMPDGTGNKNPLQMAASALTYLERYTLLAITGLAAKGQDDDGVGSGARVGYDEGLTEGLRYGMACYQHKEVIEEVKSFLADDDYVAAAEALFSLSNQELMSIRRAPSKGGIFTIEENKKMDTRTNPEWESARQEGIKLNPDVDRSI